MTGRIGRAVCILLSCLMWSCATPTYYRPAEENGTGYRDQRITENRYRVSFQGNSLTSRETVELYLLYRAAELTLEKGFEYFMLVDQETEGDYKAPSSSVLTSFGFGSRHSALGLGYYWAPGTHVRGSTQFEAAAYVTLHHKPPEDSSRVFNAKEVITNLESRIKRPKK